MRHKIEKPVVVLHTLETAISFIIIDENHQIWKSPDSYKYQEFTNAFLKVIPPKDVSSSTLQIIERELKIYAKHVLILPVSKPKVIVNQDYKPTEKRTIRETLNSYIRETKFSDEDKEAITNECKNYLSKAGL